MNFLGDPCHISSFIDDEIADSYFYRLSREIPFERQEWSHGKYLPRMVYSYSPRDFRESQCNSIDVLDELLQMVENSLDTNVHGIFCNLYRDGNDYTPFHQDSYGFPVFTVSFGDTRDFSLLPIQSGKSIKYKLENGDAFYFSTDTNSKYKHSIPRTTKKVGPRISLVFFISDSQLLNDSQLLKETFHVSKKSGYPVISDKREMERIVSMMGLPSFILDGAISLSCNK